jgi:hypothetical protein
LGAEAGGLASHSIGARWGLRRGQVSADEQDWGSLGAVVTGLVIAAGCAELAARELPRRTARRLLAGAGADEDSGQSR